MTDQPTDNTPALSIAHVADVSRCYPGDLVTFFTRVYIFKALPGFTLRIAVPDGLAPGAPRAAPYHDSSLPHLVFLEGARYLVWRFDQAAHRGECYEYQLEVTIEPTQHDLVVSSRAVVMANADPTADSNIPPRQQSQAETATLAVAAKSRSLKYLPALYTDQDEFMGRFLMLFDSFWEPIKDRIDHIEYYFDPKLTPPDLLPWLEEKYGGPGGDFLFSVIITEEIIKYGAGGLFVPLHNDVVAPYIYSFGSEEQRMKWLPKCVTGECILASFSR